jgi:hypothetical protein
MVKKDYSIYILLLFVFLAALCYKKTTIKEFLSNRETPIILAGDSIFENSNYVSRGKSVADYLSVKHKNIVIVAKDGATLNQLIPQLKNIPKHLNTPSTRLFVSIGGNDILLHFRGKVLINKDEIKSMIEQYKRIILHVKDKFNVTLYLTSIYYPTAQPCKRLHEVIKLWNDEQNKFAIKHNIKLFKIDNLLIQNKHFTNEIEPSEIGGKIIANAIENL